MRCFSAFLPVSCLLGLSLSAGLVRAASSTGGSGPSENVVTLTPFEVSSGGTNTGYGAQFSSSSSRLNLRYIDIPQTVNVITSEFLTDAFLFDSRDFAMYVPGMSPSSNTHQVETFLVRGLTTSTTYVEGFLSSRPVNRDSGLYDRTEYVKGPASAAIGRGEAGGLVNFIQKKPSGRNRTRISATYGTDSLYRGELDFDRVLTKDGSLGFRLPLYYEDSDGTRGGDLMHSNKFGIGPAFRWRIGSRTDVHLTTAYFHHKTPGLVAQAFWMHPAQVDAQVDSGTINKAIWYPGPNTPLVPYDNVFGYKPNFLEAEVGEVGLIINHRFSDSLSFRQGVKGEDITNDIMRYTAAPAVARNPNYPSGYQVTMTLQRNHTEDRAWRSQSDLLYQKGIWNTKHTFLLGFEAYRQKGLDQAGSRAQLPIDLYQPWKTPPPANYDPYTYVAVNANSDNRSKGDGYGYYLQYNGSYFSDRIQVIAGWREDNTSSESLNVRNNVNTAADATTNVPRYSIAYKPVDWASVYFLHSGQADPKIIRNRWGGDSLLNGATRYTDGRRSANEKIIGQVKAEVNEIGLKADLWRGKFVASVAYFDMDRNGFLASQSRTEVGANGIGTIQYSENFVSDGEHVEGVEVNIFGQPTQRLTFSAGGIALHGRLPRPNGTFSVIVKPTKEVSLNAKYSFRDRNRNGFEVTGGGKTWFGGWTVGILSTGKFNDDQTILNAGLAYYWNNGRYSVRVRKNNIANEVVFFAGSSQYANERTFLSLSAEF